MDLELEKQIEKIGLDTHEICKNKMSYVTVFTNESGETKVISNIPVDIIKNIFIKLINNLTEDNRGEFK